MRLSKYAPKEIATDEMKRDRFERGLKLEIRKKMAVKPPTYSALLEAALRVEETWWREVQLRQKGRNFQVASVLQLTPKVPNFNKVGLEVVFEEEEVLNQGGRDQFPLVEEDMLV